MNIEYYGPTEDVIIQLCTILNIPINTSQDWYIECSDPSNLNQILILLRNDSLSLECNFGLCMLLTSTIDYLFGANAFPLKEFAEASCLIQANDEYLLRMKYFWLEFGYAGENRAFFEWFLGEKSLDKCLDTLWPIILDS